MSEEMFKGTRKHPSVAKKTRRARFKEERDNVKRQAAEERQAEHDKLSLMEKIAKLDYKLGPNVGAVKERARLKAALENKALAEENAKKAIEAKKTAKTEKSNKKTSDIDKAIQKSVKTFVREVVKEVTEATVQEVLKKSNVDKKERKHGKVRR